ncbi:hypothetical protein CEXT_368311 [Caerostris extrusa]|uniref:Uncharacterized protein n=1 Tax=Caerostris extrusa TaxID=172846 RepID=A0AAV4WJX2_CAEEX|nr:hypothetical protein CEXT_368311 [Caerostris extrusa]
MDINRSRLIQFPATDHSHDPKHLPGKNERNGNPTSGRNHPQMGPQPDGQEPSSVPSSLCFKEKGCKGHGRNADGTETLTLQPGSSFLWGWTFFCVCFFTSAERIFSACDGPMPCSWRGAKENFKMFKMEEVSRGDSCGGMFVG